MKTRILVLIILGLGWTGWIAQAQAPAPAPAPAPAAPAPAPAAPAPAPAAPAPAPAPAPADPAAAAAAAAAVAPAPPAPAPPAEDIRQVQVKVWISEATEDGMRRVGNNLNYVRFDREVEQDGSVKQVTSTMYDVNQQFSQVTLPSPSSNPAKPPYYSQANNPAYKNPVLRPDENATAAGTQTRNGAGLAYSLLLNDTGTIDGVFRAMESKTDLDLISKPELLVVDKMPATIKAGGQVPYQTVSYPLGVANLSMTWKDVGVNLQLTPTIMPNNTVQLNITQLDVTDIMRIENLRGIDLPVFSKRSQTGFVYVPDGAPLVIGGLSSRTIRKAERRIPLLGKLPVLGMPFRARRSEAETTTLLVFVQPTIVDLRTMTDRATNAMNFWREGRDKWENSNRIETELKSMESEL